MPSELDLDRHQLLRGRLYQPWGRRAIIALLTTGLVLALLNVFGQEPSVSDVQASQARLVVDAPSTVRGGLFYQGRIEVTAVSRVDHPRLVLGQGWLEDQQVNTIEPSPTREASTNGRVELFYDALEPGSRLVVYLQLEANPLGTGRRDQSVTLLDGNHFVARATRRVRQLP